MGNKQVEGNKFENLSEVKYERKVKSLWKMYSAHFTNISKDVTLFEFKNSHNEEFTKYANNAIQILQIIRHPNVLQHITSMRDKKIYLVTHQVVPLRLYLKRMTTKEKLYGILQIGTVLNFLNNQCQLVHNKVDVDSIYVANTKTAPWIIGDFEYCLRFDEQKKLTFQSDKYEPHFKDIALFAKMIKEIFGDNQEEMPTQIKDFVKSVETNRGGINFQDFINMDFFQQESFVYVMNFLDHIESKSNEQKEEFFRNLYKHCLSIPPNLFKRRVISRFLQYDFVTEKASMRFLPHLFSPDDNKGILVNKDYKRFIPKFIKLMFGSEKRLLRVKALQTLQFYIWYVKPEVVFETLIPIIIGGSYDTDDTIVLNTFNTFTLFAKYFYNFDTKRRDTIGMQIMNNALLKIMHHLSVKESTVRPHAILCMCDLWSLPGIDKRIILSTIVEAIFDDSFEVNIHILDTMQHAYKKFTVLELVKIILPLLMNLMLCKTEEVRIRTNKLIKIILDDLRDKNTNHKSMTNMMKKINLNPFFPPESAKPLQRRDIFKGESKIIEKKKEKTEIERNNSGEDKNNEWVKIEIEEKEEEKKNERKEDVISTEVEKIEKGKIAQSSEKNKIINEDEQTKKEEPQKENNQEEIKEKTEIVEEKKD